MIRTNIARFAGLSAGAAMVLSAVAPVAAQSVAELQAQIAALMAQLQALQGGSSSASITSDLTVGSTGAQVVTLQSALVAQGHLVMPSGVAMGYFGPLTRDAVMKWQAANGVSATGYFGPLSRAKFGGSVVAGPTVPSTITTPGVEGTITVSNAPVSNSTVYEGQTMKDVLAFKAEADLSDMAIQRVRVDLGNANTFYRDIASMIYLVDDAGRTLASSALNSNTVVKTGAGRYEITLAGFSSVVPKDKSRVYTVKVDVQSSIDSDDFNSYTVKLAENGVRAIDGAGIDDYSPAADTVTKSVTVSGSLLDSASLLVSNNTSNPEDREIVAALGSDENEADKVVLMVFDIKAEKSDVEITDLMNFVVTTTGAATASTTYLYAGNGTSGQLLGSDALAGNDTDFDNISYTIPAGATRTFTLAADIRNATVSSATIDVAWTINGANVVGENENGDTVTAVSGSAAANNLIVRRVGPEISLTSKNFTKEKAIAFSGDTASGKATFNLNLKAVGGDIYFGPQASSTFLFTTYKDGSASVVNTSSSTNWTRPTGTSAHHTDGFVLPEGQSVSIPVEFVITGTSTQITSGSYAVGLASYAWNTDGGSSMTTSSFMGGKIEWRTNTVVLP